MVNDAEGERKGNREGGTEMKGSQHGKREKGRSREEERQTDRDPIGMRRQVKCRANKSVRHWISQRSPWFVESNGLFRLRQGLCTLIPSETLQTGPRVAFVLSLVTLAEPFLVRKATYVSFQFHSFASDRRDEVKCFYLPYLYCFAASCKTQSQCT